MMVETNNYLLPHAPHEKPLNKPPLHYWLIGASYHVFGFDHGAGRIPSALSALGVLTLVYILGLRLGGRLVGLTASAMLTTSYLFFSFARLSMNDMLLTLCIAGTLVCWMLVLMEQTTHPRTLVLMGYAAMALGFLTKGPIAIVLTCLPIGLEVLVSRDLTIIKKLRPLAGSLVFLLVATPYFLLVYVYHGIDPLWNFFIEQNFGRFTGTVAPRAPKPFFIYEITAFFADFLPWSPLLIVAACSLGGWREFDQQTKRQLRLLGFWILSPIIFFSFSSFKLDYYFLPVMPPAALLVAQILVRNEPLRPWARRVILTVAVLVVVFLPVLLYFTIRMVNVNFPGTTLSWLPHFLSLITLFPAVWFAVRGPIYRTLLACSFTLWAAMFSAFLLLVPAYTRFQPTMTLARSVATDSPVYTFGQANEWGLDLAMYLPISQSKSPVPKQLEGRLGHVIQSEPGAVVFVYESDYKSLLKSGEQFRVIAQAEAYKGNKLTLKSLLRPSYENLYLVGQ